MAYSSDSEDMHEDLQDSISRVLSEEDITSATWHSDRSPERDETEDESLGSIDSTIEPVVKMASRAYQLEMLDASLKENIIVAMDTGSGKTQV